MKLGANELVAWRNMLTRFCEGAFFLWNPKNELVNTTKLISKAAVNYTINWIF
jgi:hypothetical protein